MKDNKQIIVLMLVKKLKINPFYFPQIPLSIFFFLQILF